MLVGCEPLPPLREPAAIQPFAATRLYAHASPARPVQLARIRLHTGVGFKHAGRNRGGQIMKRQLTAAGAALLLSLSVPAQNTQAATDPGIRGGDPGVGDAVA